MSEKLKVFIHTNHRQIVGALVGVHALARNSATPDAFEVELIQHKDYPFFQEFEGKEFLRDGARRVWRNEDLQSFTPLRFMPPELMGYQGRCVVTDPDVFAVGDVMELLNKDMDGKAILCRPRSGAKKWEGALASSVMLLDCAKLTHWKVEESFREMFDFKRDYSDWVPLKLEPKDSIGLFENEWNDFDKLTAKTKMIHNTKRKTQPWKTGLPADFIPAEKYRWFPPIKWVMRARRKLFGDYAFLPDYQPHPDKNQEDFFFGLLRECVEQGKISEDLIRSEMELNHVRHDALEVLDRVPKLAA